MDVYYICVDGGDNFYKIKCCDNYYSAVLEACVQHLKRQCRIVVIHRAEVVYSIKQSQARD